MGKISVINKKGGVGKTPVAGSLAVDLDYYLISNDESTIETLYPDRAKVMETPALIEDAVYDFGGFADAGVINIIKHSDAIIVPCKNTPNSIKRTYQTIREIQGHAKEIAVVVTLTERGTDFEEVKGHLEKHFKGLKYFELKKSKAFDHQENTGMSISQIIEETPLTKHAYRDLAPQYYALLKYVKKHIKGASK